MFYGTLIVRDRLVHVCFILFIYLASYICARNFRSIKGGKQIDWFIIDLSATESWLCLVNRNKHAAACISGPATLILSFCLLYNKRWIIFCINTLHLRAWQVVIVILFIFTLLKRKMSECEWIIYIFRSLYHDKVTFLIVYFLYYLVLYCFAIESLIM